MTKVSQKIDFVVLWVDSTDPKWQRDRRKCQEKIQDKTNVDDDEIRYRDWDLLKYWFRSIEKFAPWVNKIHFVTYGHVPNWLNLNHPKLNIVKHTDIMPKNSLPTFNSNAIELCVHKIAGLSEQFVLFNDDMFLLQKVRPTDFFISGVPRNTMSLAPIIPDEQAPYYKTLNNNITIINRHFDFNQAKKIQLAKYLSPKQGKYLLRTIPLLSYKSFPGFANYHVPISYRKTTFNAVWQQEEQILDQTVHSKFRDYERNVNHWLFNYWQFASGNFRQKHYLTGKNLAIDNPKVPNIIRSKKYQMICLNDRAEISDFANIQNRVASSFAEILPERSQYES